MHNLRRRAARGKHHYWPLAAALAVSAAMTVALPAAAYRGGGLAVDRGAARTGALNRASRGEPARSLAEAGPDCRHCARGSHPATARRDDRAGHRLARGRSDDARYDLKKGHLQRRQTGARQLLRLLLRAG